MQAVSDDQHEASLTVGSYLGIWLAHIRGRVRGTTYEGYEALVRLHALPRLGELPLAELHPLHIQRLYSELLEEPAPGGRAISAKTVGNLHRVLRHALHQAVRWQMIGANPAAAAEPPRPRRPELFVVDAALASRILAASAATRFEVPVAIAISTGMRRGEILGLRWGDLDEGLSVARVRRSLQVTRRGLAFEEPKTPRSRRAVALPSFLHAYLERARASQACSREALGSKWQESDLVVDRGDGEPWNPDTFSRAWPAFLKARGLPHVRFHDLRHAHATIMLMQGVHPKVVSERLGHSSVGITLDTYSHVLPSMQAEAARAFDQVFPSS
jgi:integrase